MKIFKRIILMILVLFCLVGGSVIIIDPYFHYHKPLKFIKYFMDNNQQRYMNDGIVKNFNYDAIISGSSMTENFKTSQFNKLFDKNAIKVSFSGANYKEINDIIEVGLKSKKNIKCILRGLDYNSINSESDSMRYSSYPTYLYDDNIFNDYKYIFSKGSFFQCLINIINSFSGDKEINFDEYSSWRNKAKGRNVVLRLNRRLEKKESKKELSKEDIERIEKNLEKNVLDLPKKYPDVKFIYFITPYSIVYWDSLNQSGNLEKQIKMEKYMIEKILKIPNIELYSFFNNYEVVCNLDNYTDAGHYYWKINDKILDWISKKEYLLTKDNYQEYINKNLEFYKNYNYDKIYE